MKINMLSDNTVKIVLDTADMNEMNIKYENLSQDSQATKQLLLAIIKRIEIKRKISLDVKRIFVEAFPRSDGGCMVYISALDGIYEYPAKKSERCSDIIFETSSVSELIRLCGALCPMRKGTDMLFFNENENKFRLLIKSASEPLKKTITEFGDVTGGEQLYADTCEFYRLVLADAVDTLSSI